MRVLFAPDWRGGVPYQRLLADALAKRNVDVVFPNGYKRILPLSRGLDAAGPCDILHLHWPEAYFAKHGLVSDHFRQIRFPFDLRRATRRAALVTTAHNPLPHNRDDAAAARNMRTVYQASRIVLAHSTGAKELLCQTYDLDPAKVLVIPHGDLSSTLGQPVPQAQARAELGLPPTGKIALMFGAIEPYKGQEEVIRWWRTSDRDTTLAIVGRVSAAQTLARIKGAIAGDPRIMLRPDWVSDDDLTKWLSAADVAVFNYERILTSGGAALARSWGLPILLPSRLFTVDLGAADGSVHRFKSLNADFADRLADALDVPPSYERARSWRAACDWSLIAEECRAAYSQAMSINRQSASAALLAAPARS